MAARHEVTLDVLPIKRILALDEAGAEQFPVEATAEEKPLALLSRIDFGQTTSAKKAKTGKEVAPVAATVWPWQGVVQNLQQAHEDLNIIIDLISQVEENETVTLASMAKQKLLPHEAFQDLVLRTSTKMHEFRNAGKYLKRSAQALERQVEREAVFYGALMRLQRNWKVKRQRGISAGPGGSAGFSIDVSYTPGDINQGSNLRPSPLSVVNLDQDAAGLLLAQAAAGRPLNKLSVFLRKDQPRHTLRKQKLKPEDGGAGNSDEAGRADDLANTDRDSQTMSDRVVGEGVDTGAKVGHAVLRRIQAAIFDEQVFDWVGREAVFPNSGMNVVGIGDSCLQFSLGYCATLTLDLSEVDGWSPRSRYYEYGGPIHDEDDGVPRPASKFGVEWASKGGTSYHQLSSFQRMLPNELSLVVCLQQAYHQTVFGYPTILQNGLATFKLCDSKQSDGAGSVLQVKPRDPSATTSGTGVAKEVVGGDVAALLKNFSAIVRHRIVCAKVLSELEKQVNQVPSFHIFYHATWHPRVSAWDLSLVIPSGMGQKGPEWSPEEKQELRFQCTVVVRDESLTIEGLEGESTYDAPSKAHSREIVPSVKPRVGLSELSSYLLFQVSTEIVSWLHDEAKRLGLTVRRELLSVVFQLESSGDVALVACPDVKANVCNWWMKTWTSAIDEPVPRDDAPENGAHYQRFLGPLSLEALKRLVLDLVSADSSLDLIVSD